jgi:hypothetical protein
LHLKIHAGPVRNIEDHAFAFHQPESNRSGDDVVVANGKIGRDVLSGVIGHDTTFFIGLDMRDANLRPPGRQILKDR